jgi:hypothetical protein
MNFEKQAIVKWISGCGQGRVERIDEKFNTFTKEGEKRCGNGFANRDGFESMSNSAGLDTQRSGKCEYGEEFFAAFKVGDMGFLLGETIGFHGFEEAFNAPALAINIKYIVCKTHRGCQQQEVVAFEP